MAWFLTDRVCFICFAHSQLVFQGYQSALSPLNHVLNLIFRSQQLIKQTNKQKKSIIIQTYYSCTSVIMRHSMLVNSDIAVSVAHSVFLVGRRCHMKRTCLCAGFHAGCWWKAGCKTDSNTLQKWEWTQTNTSEISLQEGRTHAPLSSPLSEELIALWSLWRFRICFLGYRAIMLLFHRSCSNLSHTGLLWNFGFYHYDFHQLWN